MLEQVRPVVLPLLPTACPNEGMPMVAEGGAAAILVVPTGPRSRMAPEVSTCPAAISANAASTLSGACPQSGVVEPAHGPVVSLAAGLSFAPWVRCATVSGTGWPARQTACNG